MKVAVSVHGRFHGFDLARELQTHGLLSGLLTTYPAFAVRPHVGTDAFLVTAPWLEARRRLCQRLGGICGDVDGAIATAFGKFAAAHLPKDCDLVVGWSSAAREVIDAAHARGAMAVVERGSTHINHQTDLLTALYQRHGKVFKATSSRIIERELAEYETADAVAVPSTFAAETFIKSGVPAEKLLVNPYGVDLRRFTPPDRRDHEMLRIVFVGRVGLRKGIPELLEAFAPLAGRAELHLVGPLEPSFKVQATAHVTVRGPVAMTALAAEYAAGDIFCLPSWEEGFPLVLLQAMACGLPVVASEATGIGDIVTPGREGEIVTAGDVAALTAALEGLIEDADLRRAMGQAARARVAEGFDWSSYGIRALGLYEKLLSSPTRVRQEPSPSMRAPGSR